MTQRERLADALIKCCPGVESDDGCGIDHFAQADALMALGVWLLDLPTLSRACRIGLWLGDYDSPNPDEAAERLLLALERTDTFPDRTVGDICEEIGLLTGKAGFEE